MSDRNDNERVSSVDFNLKNNESTDYNNLKLEELKELAKPRNIVPESNKSSKDSWIEALKSADHQSRTDGLDSSDFLEKDALPNIKGKSGSLEAQELLFDEVLNKLEQRGVSLDSLSVKFDGKQALAYKNGDVNQQSLTDKQAKLLQSALNDPQNFEGTVTIKSGNRTLLKIENGQVLRDAIGLTSKSTKVEVESNTKSLYQKYSQEINGKGLGKTKKIVSKAFDDGVGRQQVKNIIRHEDDGYKNLAQNTTSEVADINLDKIVNQAAAERQLQNQQQSQSQEKNLTKAR